MTNQLLVVQLGPHTQHRYYRDHYLSPATPLPRREEGGATRSCMMRVYKFALRRPAGLPSPPPPPPPPPPPLLRVNAESSSRGGKRKRFLLARRLTRDAGRGRCLVNAQPGITNVVSPEARSIPRPRHDDRTETASNSGTGRGRYFNYRVRDPCRFSRLDLKKRFRACRSSQRDSGRVKKRRARRFNWTSRAAVQRSGDSNILSKLAWSMHPREEPNHPEWDRAGPITGEGPLYPIN